MQSDYTFLVILFLVIAAYLYVVATFTTNTESSLARFGMSVSQSFRTSTNLFIMAMVILISSWLGFPIFLVLF